MQEFKKHIIHSCKKHLEEKIQSLNNIIKEVTESSHSESKSSVGDKHETSKAMMQLEIEKLGVQLKDAEMQLAEFEKIDFSKNSRAVNQGSLVETNKGYFLIAGSIGKMIIEDKIIFVISSKSPFAVTFSGKQQKDNVSFNGVEYLINAIY